MVDDKADDEDEHILHKLKGISEEELTKYGLTIIGKDKEVQAAGSQKEDDGDGQSPPKKTKFSVEELDDLMAESWKASISSDKDGTLGRKDTYDQWAEEFKQGHKYSPY